MYPRAPPVLRHMMFGPHVDPMDNSYPAVLDLRPFLTSSTGYLPVEICQLECRAGNRMVDPVLTAYRTNQVIGSRQDLLLHSAY